MRDGSKCILPVSDRAKRTADFRALFATSLVDRHRSPGVVEWLLRAEPGVETESRRLAKLEERCCDGIAFVVRAEGDRVIWRITGPAAAAATLDALYELPLLVRTDEDAARLWTTLDAQACGPSTS